MHKYGYEDIGNNYINAILSDVVVKQNENNVSICVNIKS